MPVLDDAHDEGSETLSADAVQRRRARIIADGTATGTINNTDHMPQAWIARFGRTVADQVLDAVEGRMTAARVPGTELSVAGQRVGGGSAAPDGRSMFGARRRPVSKRLRSGCAARRTRTARASNRDR